MSDVKKTTQPEKSKALENRWGKNTVGLGWTGVPNILIERQRELDINSTEMNIIVILLKFWWDSTNPPFPSKRNIGEMLGREESTIRKAFASLEAKGLIKRQARYANQGGRKSNQYDMSGLVKALDAMSLSEIETRKTREEEDSRVRRGANRRTTKRGE